MNTQELKQLLSTLLADSSNNFYTEQERLQALNSACSYVNSELRVLRQVVEITVTPLDRGRIAIPSDFVSILPGLAWRTPGGTSTQLTYSNPLKEYITKNDTWDTAVGEPERYIMEGGAIYLSPAPSKTGTLLFMYLAMPNKLLEDTDLPFYGDVRIQAYHDMLAFYAAWQLCLKDRDFEAAQQFMQYFQTRLIDLKENLRHTGDIVQPVWSDTYSTA